jgi:hypothetical protein
MFSAARRPRYMTKTKVFLVVGFLVLAAGAYFYVYQDAFKKPAIQIFHTFRPRMGSVRRRGGPATPQQQTPPPNSIIFGLVHEYRLTAIRVVPLEELKTNKYAHPIWELVSASNSAPRRAFSYGENIQGMKPPRDGMKPDPLETNVYYRLFVEAGNIKGEHDFVISETNKVQQ